MKALPHLSTRMRYVAGGIVGAMLATGVVVLGATFANSNADGREHV